MGLVTESLRFFRDDKTRQNHRYLPKYVDAGKQLQRNLGNPALNGNCFTRCSEMFGLRSPWSCDSNKYSSSLSRSSSFYLFREISHSESSECFSPSFFKIYFSLKRGGAGGGGRCKPSEIFTKTCTVVDFRALGLAKQLLCSAGAGGEETTRYSRSPSY